MAKVTTIRFEDADYEWLRDRAHQRRISMAKVLAELIDYARGLETRDTEGAEEAQ